MGEDLQLTATQKLNSRTMWVTALALVVGFGGGYLLRADWLPGMVKDMANLGMVGLAILIGKAGK